MQSLSKYNKGNKYLLCATDLFSKYMWVVPIKDKGISTINAFKNLPNLKTEVDKLDIDKLVLLPADLNKLKDVVKKDVVKKLCMTN